MVLWGRRRRAVRETLPLFFSYRSLPAHSKKPCAPPTRDLPERTCYTSLSCGYAEVILSSGERQGIGRQCCAPTEQPIENLNRCFYVLSNLVGQCRRPCLPVDTSGQRHVSHAST